MALPLPTQTDVESDSTQVVTSTDEDSRNADEDILFADMHAALEFKGASVETEYTLPEHISCASRTLNLIATHDTDKAETDNADKNAYCNTLGEMFCTVEQRELLLT